MKEIGIKQIAQRVGEFVKTHLNDEEVCATVIGNEIVLCMRSEPAYIVTRERFSTDTPRRLLTAGINIINRMVFDLSPEEASAIVASTVSKITVDGETQAGGGRVSQCVKDENHGFPLSQGEVGLLPANR